MYFWEHTGETKGQSREGYYGGYSQRNEAMGIAANSITEGTAGLGDTSYTAPPKDIAVAQGFYVSIPTNKGGTFSFENSQRSASTNNYFFKGASNTSSISTLKLGFDYKNVNNISIHRQLGLNFKAGHTFAYESGYDSSIFDIQDTDIYWNFPEIEEKLVIAGVGELAAQMQIPLGLAIDTDEPVTIRLDETTDMDGYTVYLIDLLTGQVFNLETPKELNLSRGTYTDRFALIFGGTALDIDDAITANDLNIYADNTNKDIVLTNTTSASISKIALYNTLGQEVKSWKQTATENETRLSVEELAANVYLVKVFTDTAGIISKKIILK